MTRENVKQDKIFLAELETYQSKDKDYWSFRGNAARDHAHAYFQYPAMMVPQMQGELLKVATKADSSIKHVYDPFVGSGTALTESIMLGLDFTGHDVNPLAILLCRAKTIPFFDDALEAKLDEMLARVKEDGALSLEATFQGWNKWFRRDAAIALSRIRRSIRKEKSLWARRFLWIALAETVRRSSNSRTSTFKLHIREETERLTRTIAPVSAFEEIARRNLEHLRTAKQLLRKRELLANSRYRGSAVAQLCDSSHSEPESKRIQADFLLTSPPYGDNATTIPYGQHSYLPLQWIDSEDIDCGVDATTLGTTHEIDSRSLGGSKAIQKSDLTELRQRSRHFGEALRKIKDMPADRTHRVAAFCRDLNACIDPILSRLKNSAYMVWIVGNRRVGGHALPLDQILSDLLMSRSTTRIARIQRIIPTKRMAVRNDVSDTMGRESILVFRKG